MHDTWGARPALALLCTTPFCATMLRHSRQLLVELAVRKRRFRHLALACFLNQYRVGDGDETMMTTTTPSKAPLTRPSATQQVVVVSKQSQLNGLLETVLDAGQYDVVFVESTEHAYSHIKRLMPHLIIVCLDVDELDAFQVLSMLKM